MGLNDQQLELSKDQALALRKDITEYGLRAYNSGFVTETEGNISARIGKNRVLVTPSHVPYEREGSGGCGRG